MSVVVRLMIVVLFAVAGYQRAKWFERRYSRTPWGWPPILWAVVFGLSLFLGALLLVLAERSGRRSSIPQYPAFPYGAAAPAAPPYVGPAPLAGAPYGNNIGYSSAQPPPRQTEVDAQHLQGWKATQWEPPTSPS
jgi:hypothetical protein